MAVSRRKRRRMPTIDFQSLRNFQRGGRFPYYYILIIFIIILIVFIIVIVIIIIIIIMFFL